ncbi:hypothetical protein [Herbaspirillum aquaticum]|uniref:Phage tail protein n=1 Tax=Herbaspirillum aquaticum TaxID=568783 RepID=A0A225SMJ4_9BURK|nr:hypothetical protein [Herbaspirillum aquaticum]OWY32207.1 hypothetical protein CEJ45_22130 [Herbaspirillum aquaticum]
MFFSKSTNGFYDPKINLDGMPEDAIEIGDDVYRQLLDGQAAGKIISADENGFPILLDAAPISAREVVLAQILALEATVTQRRLRDAILGTDGGWLKDVESKIAALRAKL